MIDTMQLTSIAKIIIREFLTLNTFQRIPESDLVMTDSASVTAFDEATESNGPVDGIHAFILLHVSSVLNGARTAIDLGCGSGQLLLKIAQLHPQITFTGVDLSDAMLEKAEKNRITLGLQNVKFLKQDICDLKDFKTSSQEAVISSLSMHHLPDLEHLEKMLNEVKRVATLPRRIFLFDHGRLNALESVNDVIDQHRYLSLPLLVDFEASLKASFSPAEINEKASNLFGSELDFYRLVPTPLYLMLISRDRSLNSELKKAWTLIFKKLSSSTKSDFNQISMFFRLNGLSRPKVKP